MLASGMGFVTATAALWVQRRERVDRRYFAGLVSVAVTLILFSVLAWAATAIVSIAPRFVTWVLVGTLALLFAVRLYRELQIPPPREPR
jgi:peptidoglycan/LPS O-acetylase OafA/YrhL